MLIEAGHQESYNLVQLYAQPSRAVPLSVATEANERSNDIMAYSQYVNGSVFTIPQVWSQQSTDDLLVAVYSFVKTYIR